VVIMLTTAFTALPASALVMPVHSATPATQQCDLANFYAKFRISA
jgi:hypothetical protein